VFTRVMTVAWWAVGIGVLSGCYREMERVGRTIALEPEESTATRPAPPSDEGIERPEPEEPVGVPTSGPAPTTHDVTARKIRAVIETNLGHMEAELWPDAAPNTVAHFVRLAEAGFYENLPCHRMVPGFMVQLGKPIDPAKENQVRPIRGEFNPTLKHGEGTLSMARQPSDPDSATTQFFICFKPKTQSAQRALTSLDGKYAIFGKVTRGLDVLQEIESVPTTTQPMGPDRVEPSKPTQPILLRAVRIIR